MRPIIILGGGGHAKVLIDTLKKNDREIMGIVDGNLAIGDRILGVEVLGDDTFISRNNPDAITLVNGVGSMPGKNTRSMLYEKFKNLGYEFETVVHPSVIIGEGVKLGEGVQVMARVVLQPNASIEDNTIINTGALIDHDCQIGRDCHIAPGVTLSGEINIGDKVHVGTGASIIQGIQIGDGSIIGAGSIVLKDVPRNVVAYGKPALVIRENSEQGFSDERN